VAIDRFKDDVPEEIKRRRNNQLLAAQQETSAEFNRELIGQRVEVLVEGESKLVSRREPTSVSGVELGWEKRKPASAQLVGRTRGDQVVVFDGQPSMKGQLIQIQIVDAQSLTLFGKFPIPKRAILAQV
jgi:tRNA-2-methylthio-N6-dimethylallyladenosine synthase